MPWVTGLTTYLDIGPLGQHSTGILFAQIFGSKFEGKYSLSVT